MMTQRLLVGLDATAHAEIGDFLTDRGSYGLEGTGLLACAPSSAGAVPWRAVRFVVPDQRAKRRSGACSVEVTEAGKRQLAAELPVGQLYLVRVHSHPEEAFHSPTDDANPALPHTGALSIVVPFFGLGLRRGLDVCAVYRLDGGIWHELPPGPDRERWLVEL